MGGGTLGRILGGLWAVYWWDIGWEGVYLVEKIWGGMCFYTCNIL